MSITSSSRSRQSASVKSATKSIFLAESDPLGSISCGRCRERFEEVVEGATGRKVIAEVNAEIIWLIERGLERSQAAISEWLDRNEPEAAPESEDQ